MMMPNDVDLDWLSASDALNKIVTHRRDQYLVKHMLADLLKDGVVRARADRMWTSSKPTLNAAWRARASASAEHDVLLSPLIWQRSRFWLDDLELWRWTRNRFVVTAGLTPPERIILEGVRLRNADLEKVLDTFPSMSTAERARTGRPIKRDKWDMFWMGVVDIAHNQELNLGNFNSQEALRRHLLEGALESEDPDRPHLSEESIKPLVRDIWYRFVQPKVAG